MSEENKDDKLVNDLSEELAKVAEQEEKQENAENSKSETSNNDNVDTQEEKAVDDNREETQAQDNNGGKKPKKKRSKLRIALIIIGSMFGLGVLGVAGLAIYIYMLSLELPSTDEFSKFKYNEPMVVYDAKGTVIAELGAERRYPVPIEEMPKYVYQAVVAVEDGRFFEHSGIDPWGIARAMVTNIKAGRMVEGGSTLTQQLVKIIYLTPERKLKRKIKEAIIAYRLDKELTKEKILELYLNQVNFGRGAYGIQAAAINYFGKNVKDMTIAEAAMVAGIPKGPSIYAPHLNMKKSINRRNHVLKRMRELNFITEEEYQTAKNEKVVLAESVPLRLRYAGYFMDYVHKFIEEDLKIEDAQNKGIKVFTTLNLDYQIAAEKALLTNLMSIGKKEGYGGVLGQLLIEDEEDENFVEETEPVVVEETENQDNTTKYIRLDNNIPNYLEELKYKKAVITKVDKALLDIALYDNSTGIINLKENDWVLKYKGAKVNDFTNIFNINDVIYVTYSKTEKDKNIYLIEQDPALEGAIVSVNPQTGEIYAMVGGMSYFKSFFNRAVQAKRQVGSTFKPLVYATAYESGYYPMSIFHDTPVIQESDEKGEENWRPKNFDGQFRGEMTLERALQSSNNSVTIKLAQKIGVKKIIRYAKMFGFTGDIPVDLSVSLGSLSASPLELAYAYTTFANQGKKAKSPYFITRVADIDNKTIYEAQPPEMVKVLEPTSASLITDGIVKVVEKGGAWRSRNSINRVFGGKTGTSNESKDCWFAGVMPNLVTVAWVGYDDYSKMGDYAVGANTSQFIFIDYMKAIDEILPFALFPTPVRSTYFKVNKETNEMTDAVTGDLMFSLYPVDRNNKFDPNNYKK